MHTTARSPNIYQLTRQLTLVFMLVWAIVVMPRLSLVASPAEAPETVAVQGLSLEVMPGLGGYFRVGEWTPLRLTLDNKGPSFAGTVQLLLSQGSLLSDHHSTVTYSKQVYLPEYTRVSFAINANLGNTPRPMLARLVDSRGRVLLSGETSVRRSMTVAPVILVVGTNSGYEQLVGAGPGMVSKKVAYIETRDLPGAWLALQGVSVIIVHGTRNLDMDAAQLLALTQWVDTGGRLIVADGAGERPTQAIAYALLPAFIGGATLPLVVTGKGQVPPPQGAIVSENARKAGAHSPWRTIDTPLMGSTWSFGRGQVTYLPWDPLGRAFGSWPLASRAWAALLPPVEGEVEPDVRELAPGMGAIYRSRWTMILFCGVYVAGLRLLLRASSVQKNGHGTVNGAFWPLAALQILVFAAVGLLALGLPGLVRNTGLSQISLLLGTPNARYVEVQSFINGFSPQAGTFKMTFRPDVQGLVQTSRYGTDWPDANYSLDESYSTVSMKLARWQGFDLLSSSVYPTPLRVEGPVRRLSAGRPYRVYTLTNLASQPITDAAVVFEEQTRPIGDMKPFEKREVSVPARPAVADMVPVADAPSLAMGQNLSREEFSNRVSALDSALRSYHSVGPAFVGWLREPVWEFVKYGGLRIRTSVGLVMLPLDVSPPDPGDEDAAEEVEGL